MSDFNETIPTIFINNFETEPTLPQFTDQTTEATISKFGSVVLYSIKTKMRNIKSVLIKALIYRKNLKKTCSLFACILKICLVLIHSRQIF